MNPRPHGPEPCALPTALHPDSFCIIAGFSRPVKCRPAVRRRTPGRSNQLHRGREQRQDMLMPIPVHRMASRRGSREMMKISSCSKLPARSSPGVRSITPTNSEQQDKTSNRAKRTMVERYGLIQSSPFFNAVSYG